MIESGGAALQPYLLPGDRIAWTGRPGQGVRLRAADAFLIPFSLLWGGFAIFWEATAIGFAFRAGEGITSFMALWGIPFVMVGLYLIFGRFFVDAHVRARTFYAVTDRRVLVLRRVFGERLLSRPLGGEVRIAQRRGGSGTLEFGSRNPLRAFNGWSMWAPGLGGEVAFEDVPDVMTVYALAAPGRAAA